MKSKSKSEGQKQLKCTWVNKFTPVPDGLQASTVIRGPFRSTILMKTTPSVEVHPKLSKPGCQITLKTGIPDPWSLYVLHKYMQGNRRESQMEQREPIIASEWEQLLEVTEDLVERHHLPFLQGIPDPWKSWPNYLNASCLRNKDE